MASVDVKPMRNYLGHAVPWQWNFALSLYVYTAISMDLMRCVNGPWHTWLKSHRHRIISALVLQSKSIEVLMKKVLKNLKNQFFLLKSTNFDNLNVFQNFCMFLNKNLSSM
jgi:hypothetical protein